MTSIESTPPGLMQRIVDRARVWLGVVTLTFRAMQRCFFTVLGVAIILAFFTLPPQGKEILSFVVEDAAWSRFWPTSLILSAAAVATVAWYTSRVLMDFHDIVDLKLETHELAEFGRRLDTWLPRVLGALCVLPLVFFLADVGVKTYVLSSPLLIVAAFALLAAVDGAHGRLRWRVYRWGFVSSLGFILLSHRWVTEIPYGQDFTWSNLGRALFRVDNQVDFATTGFQLITAAVAWLILDQLCVRWSRRQVDGKLDAGARSVALVVLSAATLIALLAWVVTFRSALLRSTPFVVAAMLFTAVLVISFFTHRREWFPGMFTRRSVEAATDDAKGDSTRGASRPQVNVARFTKVLLLAALAVGTAVFAFVWVNPVEAGQLLGAPALLLVAVGIWVVFGGIVLTMLPKSYRLPSLGLLPLITAGCNALSDAPITISMAKRDPTALVAPAAASGRPDVRKAFKEWIDARDERKDGPIYLVTAAGGGIRAAFLTASYLAAADDVTAGEFGRRVFAISGVSGGSLGAATYALLGEGTPNAECGEAKRQPALIEARQRAVLCTLGNDFLSPTVATFLFPDLFRAFWIDPIFYRNSSWRDRGRTLEEAWASSGVLKVKTFEGRFLDYAKGAEARRGSSGNVHLVLNATRVQSGQRVVASTVTWPMLSAIDLLDPAYDTADVSMVGAVHNSARFTYVSPAGAYFFGDSEKKLAGQVADGGYFDNSGGLSLLEILAELQQHSAAPRIRVIVITNDGSENTLCGASDSTDVASEVQLAAPIATFLATRPARAELSKAQLKSLLAAFHGAPTLCGGDGEPIGPLTEVSLHNDLVAEFLYGEAANGTWTGNCDDGTSPAASGYADKRTVDTGKEIAVRVKEAPPGWTLSATTTDWLTRYARKEACKLKEQLRPTLPG